VTRPDFGTIAVVQQELLVLYFDDLAVGDEWVSPRRTVTESDVVAFACLSGDFNALHVDHEFARKTPFGRPVAHGLLGMAIASGLASQHPRVATIAFLDIPRWTFLEPLFFGDTIHVRTEVIALETRAHGRRGVVTWQRRIVNQASTPIQEGLTRTLVQGRRQPSQAGVSDAGRESTSSEDSSS
jgi:acyl dehydratase